MERLTVKTPTGAALALNDPRTEQEAKEQLMTAYRVAMNRLSAYEDTGLEPVEIEELIVKLDKCKELLRMAVEELEEQMNNLCEAVDKDSCYSPCTICLNQLCCTDEDYKGVEWIHADKVEEVLKNER